MKITTTQTTTETKEMNITFPTFTKNKSSVATYYYAVLSEFEVAKVTDYQFILGSFSIIGNVSSAFENGFEFIDEEEFFKVYQFMIDEVRVKFNQIKLDLAQLQLDAKVEQERAEYFEYQDDEIAERQEIIED